VDYSYKDHQIEVDARPAPDDEGRWRVYVTVAFSEAGSTRTKRLSFRDGRTFASQAEAEAAGRDLAKADIDGP
jgi:hypothetical protein